MTTLTKSLLNKVLEEDMVLAMCLPVVAVYLCLVILSAFVYDPYLGAFESTPFLPESLQPSPLLRCFQCPVFQRSMLREFLLTKLINAEISCYKAQQFSRLEVEERTVFICVIYQ